MINYVVLKIPGSIPGLFNELFFLQFLEFSAKISKGKRLQPIAELGFFWLNLRVNRLKRLKA